MLVSRHALTTAALALDQITGHAVHMPRRPPLVGDEKSTLHAALALHRDAVLWKIEGLGDEQLRRPGVASGTNLLGVVKHLAGVEYEWPVTTFERPAEPLETDPVRDMNAGEDETTEDVVGFYRRACAAADEVIEQLDLHALGTAWFSLDPPPRFLTAPDGAR